MKLVITGGGTGGHIFGGIAIAQEFLRFDKNNEVLFIGSKYGLETRLIPKAGFQLQTLAVGKLVGQSFFRKLLTLLQIPVAILRCFFLLLRFKPNFIIGVGGYAAGPCILAGRILHIPVGILEQNAVAGFTNRVSAMLAQKVFTAFSEPPMGINPKKCIYTGNPSRSELRPCVKKDAGALQASALPNAGALANASALPDEKFVVFAFGGSQGATAINHLMIEAAKLLEKSKIEIIHQTGPRDYDWVVKKYQELGVPAEVFAFTDRMQAMYDRCSIVVCRAGSSTIAELAATGNTAVFIPYPTAAGNHQEKNAKILEQAGAALMLTQQEAVGEDLTRIFEELILQPEKLKKMREKIHSFHHPEAAAKILKVMESFSSTV